MKKWLGPLVTPIPIINFLDDGNELENVKRLSKRELKALLKTTGIKWEVKNESGDTARKRRERAK